MQREELMNSKSEILTSLYNVCLVLQDLLGFYFFMRCLVFPVEFCDDGVTGNEEGGDLIWILENRSFCLRRCGHFDFSISVHEGY